jgi:hypothetical protein
LTTAVKGILLVIYSTGIDIVKFCFWQVHEGRNHEVRELVQNAGLKVVLCDQYILVNFLSILFVHIIVFPQQDFRD